MGTQTCMPCSRCISCLGSRVGPCCYLLVVFVLRAIALIGYACLQP